MNKYHVTYYYLATGMEGKADTNDYGYIEAESAQEAVDKVGMRINPRQPNKADRNWGLSASLVHKDTSNKLGNILKYARGETVSELAALENDPMEKTTLTSQTAVIAAIRNKSFIVGSVDQYGNMSFSNTPAIHTHRASARAECARLAKLSPGKFYIFVELAGGEMLPAAVATISI